MENADKLTEWQRITIRERKKDVQAGRIVSHEDAARWWGEATRNASAVMRVI